MSFDLVIAGAGIGGLTAALAARLTGRTVVVVERAPHLAELGAGLQLSANSSRVLIALGLEERLARVATETEGKCIRLWSTGERWKLFDLGQDSRAEYGAPYWMVHRGDLHRELLDAAIDAGVEFRLGATVTGYRKMESGAALLLESGDRVEGDAIVGADGVHSVMRNQMIGTDRPKFTGIMAWRGLADATKLPSHLLENVGTNWVGPHRHVITYPLRKGQLMNFVGVVERDDWTTESWTESGEISDLLMDFDGWHEDVQTIIRALDEPFAWALLGRDPIDRCVDGPVALLGDAQHPTLPFLAQGASMAIEDAAVVVRCLDHYSTPEQAFLAFEKMRLPRTSEIVSKSTDQIARFHNPAYDVAETAADIIGREWAPNRVRDRYDWLFRYNALTVEFPVNAESH